MQAQNLYYDTLAESTAFGSRIKTDAGLGDAAALLLEILPGLRDQTSA
jgi:hypothetical protein